MVDGGSGDEADSAPWLIMDSTIERAILIALIRRNGGQLTIGVDELRAATDVTWSLEGFRSSEDPGKVRLRLRRLD
jgi:hypothetical protein